VQTIASRSAIGYGLIGGEHVRDFKKQSDATWSRCCDVYSRASSKVSPRAAAARGATAIFASWLDDKDISGSRRLTARPLARAHDHHGVRAQAKTSTV